MYVGVVSSLRLTTLWSRTYNSLVTGSLLPVLESAVLKTVSATTGILYLKPLRIWPNGIPYRTLEWSIVLTCKRYSLITWKKGLFLIQRASPHLWSMQVRTLRIRTYVSNLNYLILLYRRNYRLESHRRLCGKGLRCACGRGRHLVCCASAALERALRATWHMHLLRLVSFLTAPL